MGKRGTILFVRENYQFVLLYPIAKQRVAYLLKIYPSEKLNIKLTVGFSSFFVVTGRVKRFAVLFSMEGQFTCLGAILLPGSLWPELLPAMLAGLDRTINFHRYVLLGITLCVIGCVCYMHNRGTVHLGKIVVPCFAPYASGWGIP